MQRVIDTQYECGSCKKIYYGNYKEHEKENLFTSLITSPGGVIDEIKYNMNM